MALWENGMGYHTYYVFSVQWWPLPLIIILAVACLLVWAHTRSPLTRVFFLGAAALLAGILLFAVSLAFGQWRSVKRAYAEGRVHSIEGVVERFTPAPPEGHRDEAFAVGGVVFSYSGYENRGGYNRTAARGGLIRNGLRVRIGYVATEGENRIVSLEIADSAREEVRR
jgi:hypothetical protein